MKLLQFMFLTDAVYQQLYIDEVQIWHVQVMVWGNPDQVQTLACVWVVTKLWLLMGD